MTGLSNKEFGSTFRSLEFPFKDDQSFGSLEIYHAAHGKYETNSPVKTFTTLELNGEAHVIASYTCTPLVVFPLSDLKNGEHAKGRTIAELGNRNTPLDIIEIKSEGERYILLANSSIFTPFSKLATDKYNLILNSVIEDLAGNNFMRNFDQEIDKKLEKDQKKQFILSFEVKT